MAEKTLNIDISTPDLSALKGAGYSLCLAKKVEGHEFNVAWHVYEQFLGHNRFTWTSEYELFASTNFVPGRVVTQEVAPVRIETGQQSRLDKVGILSSPEPGGAAAALTLRNDYGSIHPGINQWSGGLDRKPTSAPIFLTAKPVLKGITELTPVELIMVWFEQNIQTGTMFDRLPPTDKAVRMVSKTVAIKIDFSSTNEQTVSYKDQNWSKGALS
jgi:hypothetical protein